MTQFQVKLGADGDWQCDVARLSLVRAAGDAGGPRGSARCHWPADQGR
ncbi:hypothetical protein [Roseovarius sp. M141]|nr:hypothetical protein [Roseovarius sp. M141]